MLQTQTRSVYSERELVAAEGLIMLWRSWQTPMYIPAPAQRPSPTATNEVPVISCVRTPPVSRHSSPSEALSIPSSEISSRPSETIRAYLNSREEKRVPKVEVVSNESSNASEALKVAVSNAIYNWRSATMGAECLPAKAVAKITHDEVLKTTRHVVAGPSTSCLTPINNVGLGRTSRVPSSTPYRVSSSGRNKENIRIKRERPDCDESETKPCVKLIPIGDGNARIPAYILNTMDWKRYKAATRTLLEVVFGRSTLATHNLTGKPSPAFPHRVPKGKLDEALVRDIVQTVVVKSGVSASLVRSSITSKCADEGKMHNDRKYNTYSYYEN